MILKELYEQNIIGSVSKLCTYTLNKKNLTAAMTVFVIFLSQIADVTDNWHLSSMLHYTL